jgi:hypothetical protein
MTIDVVFCIALLCCAFVIKWGGGRSGCRGGGARQIIKQYAVCIILFRWRSCTRDNLGAVDNKRLFRFSLKSLLMSFDQSFGVRSGFSRRFNLVSEPQKLFYSEIHSSQMIFSSQYGTIVTNEAAHD